MLVRVLSKSELESILTMKDTIAAVEEGFKHFYLEKAIMPPRTVVDIDEHDALFTVMPAYIRDMESLTTKIVTLFPRNPREHNLPSTMGTVLLNDPNTGSLLSIMDGGYVTAMRTGAVGAVAAKYLAREDSRTVGVIGTGVQAKTQLMAICEVRDIEKAKAYDVSSASASRYADEMSGKLGIDVIAVDSNKDVVVNSDIVVTSTTANKPVLDGEWIRGGTHINGIGSHKPDIRELDTTTVQKSKVVVDSRKACLAEAGDLIIPIREGAITHDHIYAELGEIIGGAQPGRTSDGEITLFKSVGLAIQDASAAAKAYKTAVERSIGRLVEL